MIPYGRQSISDEDIQAVLSVLESDFLTTGPLIAEFEQAFAEQFGAGHAVAVSSGTAALHLAMLAAGIGPGDRVVTSPVTFLASANCAAFMGASPDFVDIDSESYCLSPESLAQNWQSDTKAVVAVDYAGQSAEMPAISDIARTHNALVIEDACHAIGGKFEYQGKTYPIGGHPWADITTYSFHPVKSMTTGEGGMLVTNHEEIAEKARLLRNHGMVKLSDRYQGLGNGDHLAEYGPWYYEMQELGYNYRLTDIQCALGLSQLQRLDEFIQRRREIVARYNEGFENLDHVVTPQLRNHADQQLTSWHLYTLQIDFEAIGRTRTQVMTDLKERGIGTQVLYIPVHLQPWYRQQYGYQVGKCPVAEEVYPRLLSLPLFPAMSDDDVDFVISEFINYVQD